MRRQGQWMHKRCGIKLFHPWEIRCVLAIWATPIFFKGFFLGFCDVVKMVVIHKIIQANFGYIPNLKVEKTTGSFNILGYLPEIIIQLGDLGIFVFKIWRIWAIFFSMNNPLYRLKPCFFRSKFGKNSSVKKSLVKTQDHTHMVFISNLLSRCVGFMACLH